MESLVQGSNQIMMIIIIIQLLTMTPINKDNKRDFNVDFYIPVVNTDTKQRIKHSQVFTFPPKNILIMSLL